MTNLIVRQILLILAIIWMQSFEGVFKVENDGIKQIIEKYNRKMSKMQQKNCLEQYRR